MKRKTKGRNKHYNKFGARLDEEIQDWLKSENAKYKSWNLFFKELKKRYEQK
jgi:hypothetical protein